MSAAEEPQPGAPLPAPHVRPTRLEDYPRIAQLGLAHALDVPPYEDWSRLWLENPVRTRLGKHYPIGWVLETPRGEVVGCMGTVHAPYTFRGENLISAVARAWFVPVQYRGFALELMDAYMNQPGVDLVVNSAVSSAAHAMFSQFCAPVPLGQWDSFSYWITGYRAFAQRVLDCGGKPFSHLLALPVSAAMRLKDAATAKPLRQIPDSFTIESAEQFDSRFDVFWEELRRQHPEKLIAERSSTVLSWHFAIPMRRRRLWILSASRNGRMRAYCTLTRQDHAFRLPALPHGDTQGIRGMRLVDYQTIEPDVDFLPELLRVALKRCTREGFYILENLGRGVPKMRVVDECAPHRKNLENWKFYYRASDPALDAELRQPRFWDPSAYDGDASFE
ncbi:MAG: hypothetical protein JO092_04990 [Candidatus Eremiobacteraeota bacterium]|nr:hypothetical protein [Candidatus Eremiobacteraeota bacterium]